MIPHSLRIISKGFKSYKKILFVLCLFGLIGGLLEMLGVNALIPLLGLILQGVPQEMNFITQLLQNLFLFFRIPLNVFSLLVFISTLFLMKSIVLLYFQYIQGRMIANYELQERTKILEKILCSKWSFLQKQKVGNLDKVLTQDVALSTFLLRDVGRILLILSNCLIYSVFALLVSPTVVSVSLVFGAIFFFSFRPLFRKTAKFSKLFVANDKIVGHYLNQIILGIKTIKTVADEKSVIQNANSLFEELKRLRIKLHLYSNLGGILAQPIIIILLFSILYFSSSSPGFDFGSFVVTIYLIQKIFVQIESLQVKVQKISEFSPFLESNIKYVAAAQNQQELDAGNEKFSFADVLLFENVSFGYTKERLILKDFSLGILSNETVGLVGHSGAGKTTVVDLLLRLLEPTSGSITIDGRQTILINKEDWKKHVAYVPQDSFLVNGTIEQNIRFFRDDIQENDIIDAIKMTHLDEFLKKEPQGLSADVGERGLNFSVGQRQRIVLARALAKRPKILILDEATSALDYESEAEIQKTMKDLKGKMCIIIISHKPTMLIDVDRLIVLDQGEIIEMGSPHELQKDSKSFYSNMKKV